MTTCSECGKQYGIGDWPFCPHGPIDGPRPFKPYIDENLLDHDVLITNMGQVNQIMRETHAVDRPRGQGNKGCWV